MCVCLFLGMYVVCVCVHMCAYVCVEHVLCMCSSLQIKTAGADRGSEARVLTVDQALEELKNPHSAQVIPSCCLYMQIDAI